MKKIAAILLVLLLLIFSTACENTVNSNDEDEVLSEKTYNKFVMITFNSDAPHPAQNDLYFFDSQNGISVGLAGTYFVTSDAGKTWELLSTPENVDLWRVSGLNNKYWFASTKNLDENYIYKYDNNKFSKLALPAMQKKDYVSSIYFVNNKIGYATTARDWSGGTSYNLIIKTNDGGTKWDTAATFSVPVQNLKMFDENNGFCTTTSIGIIKTTDGWNSWTSVTPNNLYNVYSYPSISHIEKIDDSHFIAVGGAGFNSNQGFVCTSSDGGNTWEYSLIEHTLRDVAVTSSKIFVCGEKSYVAKCDIDLNNFSSKNIISKLKAYNCTYEKGSDFITTANAPWGAHTEFNKIQFTDDTHGFISSRTYRFKIVIE